MSCCNLLLLFLLYWNISFCFLTFYIFYREKKGQEEYRISFITSADIAVSDVFYWGGVF